MVVIVCSQEALVTLIVVTEIPVAWHDTETFVEEIKVGDKPLGLEYLEWLRPPRTKR